MQWAIHLSARNFYFLSSFSWHFFPQMPHIIILLLLLSRVVLFICGIECADVELCQLMQMGMFFVHVVQSPDWCMHFIWLIVKVLCTMHLSWNRTSVHSDGIRFSLHIDNIHFNGPWAINQTINSQNIFHSSEMWSCIYELLCDLQFRMSIQTFALPIWRAHFITAWKVNMNANFDAKDLICMARICGKSMEIILR